MHRLFARELEALGAAVALVEVEGRAREEVAARDLARATKARAHLPPPVA